MLPSNKEASRLFYRIRMRDLKTEHFEDLQLFDNRVHIFWSALLIIGLLVLPYFVKSYYLTIINLMAVNVVVALGLNLLVGNTGQISLGHAGFVAIGAYTTVMLMKVGIPFPLAMIASGLLAALFGILLGIPSLKLEGPYLAIATLAFGLAVTILIGRMDFLGGRMGMNVPKLSLKWTGLKYDTSLYYVIISVTIIAVIVTRNILKSRIGRAFQAIRDSDIAAEAIGINLTKYKLYSFGLSAMLAGVSGSLWALYIGFINPTLFTFILSITLLATIVLGGLGSVTGSIMGAVVMTFLTIQLQNVVDIPLIGPAIKAFSEAFMNPSGVSNISWVLTGLILILVVLFEPLGLYGLWIRTKIYWKRWPF
jgi:branched-chain amino acid transport system permease protein